MSTQTSRRPSFLRTLRGLSPALWPARLRLMSLKASYKAGTYSGHPEDMLDRIDGNEDLIRRYKDGVRPVKSAPEAPAAAVVKEPVRPQAPAKRNITEQRVFEELTARSDIRGGPFEEGLEAAERRLSFMKGLYAEGGYLGHPEEMLEDIEGEERRVARLKAEAAAS